MNKCRGPQKRVISLRPLAGVEMALKIRRRARLRRKEASEFLRRLADEFGMAVPPDGGVLYETEGGAPRPLLRGEAGIGLFLQRDVLPANPGLPPLPGPQRAGALRLGA